MCICCCPCSTSVKIYKCIPYALEEKTPFLESCVEYSVKIIFEEEGVLQKNEIYFNARYNENWKNIYETIKNIINECTGSYTDSAKFYEENKNKCVTIKCIDRSWSNDGCYFINEIIDNKLSKNMEK